MYPLVSFTHSSLLGWRQDDAKASSFKVPLLFGGNSKEGIGGNSRPRAIHLSFQILRIPMGVSVERESNESYLDLPRATFTSVVISAASSLSSKPSHPLVASFCINKNPQTHPEASLLVLTESGRGDFESLLEHIPKPNHLCVSSGILYT